jgi:hypothetical protein
MFTCVSRANRTKHALSVFCAALIDGSAIYRAIWVNVSQYYFSSRNPQNATELTENPTTVKSKSNIKLYTIILFIFYVRYV